MLLEVKVKCTLVQALTLCTGRTAHRGSRGIALPFHDHDTRRGWGVSVTPRPLFTPGKDPVPIVQEAGWAPGPVWTGAENLAPTGIRSTDRPIVIRKVVKFFFFSRCNSPLVGLGLPTIEASRSRSVIYSTVCRTPPDGWSARRRDFYLTTHNTHDKETSIPPAEIEPAIPASEWQQTHALEGAANGTGFVS